MSAIITRDGLPIAETAEPLAWFHRNTAASMSHAVENEGYDVIEPGEAVYKAARAVLNMHQFPGTRRAETRSPIPAHGVSLVYQLAELAEWTRQGNHDYIVTGRIAAGIYEAATAALDYFESPADLYRGQLSTSLELFADVIGIER